MNGRAAFTVRRFNLTILQLLLFEVLCSNGPAARRINKGCGRSESGSVFSLFFSNTVCMPPRLCWPPPPASLCHAVRCPVTLLQGTGRAPHQPEEIGCLVQTLAISTALDFKFQFLVETVRAASAPKFDAFMSLGPRQLFEARWA